MIELSTISDLPNVPAVYDGASRDQFLPLWRTTARC